MLRGQMRRLENIYGGDYNTLRRARSLLVVVLVFVLVTLIGAAIQSVISGMSTPAEANATLLSVVVWQVAAIAALILLFQGQLGPAVWAHGGGLLAGLAVGVLVRQSPELWPLGSLFIVVAALTMRRNSLLLLAGAYTLGTGISWAVGSGLPYQAPLTSLIAGVVGVIITNQLESAFDRAERRAANLGTLLELGQRMTTVLALDDMLPDVTQRIMQEFDLERVRVALLQEGEGTFIQRIEATGRGINNEPQPLNPENNPLLATVYRDRTPATQVTETRAVAAFPMFAGRTLVGALLVESSRDTGFTQRETDSLQTFANQLALAVENTRTMGSEAAVLEATNPVFRATQEVATVLNASDIIGVLRRLIVPEADHLSLITVGFGPVGEPVGEVLASWDRDGLEPDTEFPEEVRLHVGSQQVIVTDASTLPDEQAVLRDYARHMLRARSFFLNPLKVRDRTVGYLLVAKYTPYEFSERDIRTLETLSGPVGVVLDNLTLLETLSDQADRLGDINTLALDAIATEGLIGLATATEAALMRSFDLTYFSFTTSSSAATAELVTFTEGRTTAEDFVQQRGGDLPRRQFSLTGTSIEEATNQRQPVHRDVIPRPDLDTWVPEYAHSILVVPLPGGGSLNLGFGLEQIIEANDIKLVEQFAAIFDAVLEKNLYLETISARQEESSALYSTSLAFNAAESLAEIYETALYEFANVTDAQRILIYIAGPAPREDKVDYVLQVAMLDHGRLVIEENPIHYTLEEAPVISQFPQSRANLVFNNAANDPRLSEGIRDSFAVRGVNSAMVVPVATGTTWLGAVIAEHFGDKTFTSDGLRRSRSIADQSALAIESQLLLEQFQTTVARERALREVSDRIRSATDRQAVVDIAANEVSQVIGITPEEAQAITTRTTQRQKLSRNERELIESITNQVDLAIQNLALLEAAEQAAFREQLINEMTADLQRAVSVDEVMQTAVRLLATSLGDYDVRLKLTERQKRLLQQAGGTGPLGEAGDNANGGEATSS